MFKNFKEFFGFSKKELNGLAVFCVLLTAVALFPVVYPILNPPAVYDYTDFKKEIALFMASASEQNKSSGYVNRFTATRQAGDKPSVDVQPFLFDPNGLDESGWQRLGLRQYQIKMIKNYEAKGGRFYSKQDLKKIYSIKDEDYARLEPYINLPEKGERAAYPKAGLVTLSKKVVIINLNEADSTDLVRLNGIGPAYASRIMKYRNRLGGFVRKEQLREVYGLDSATYSRLEPHIIVDARNVSRVLINSVSFEELKRHPYLTYKQMNAILKYRKQHGDFKSVDDLKSVAILSQDVIDKIAPYLSFSTK
jgi:competence protein ComEA